MLSKGFKNASGIAEFLSFWIEEKLLSEENQAFIDNYYDEWIGPVSPRLRYWYESQIREITELIAQRPGSRLLEVGSGCGTECLWFALQGAEVVWIDVFERATSVARERLKLLQDEVSRGLSCRLETRTLLDLKDDMGFDIIWPEQAFHHLEPRARVVEKLSELLRPGGSYRCSRTIISLPRNRWRDQALSSVQIPIPRNPIPAM